jgi:predicted acyltransferase
MNGAGHRFKSVDEFRGFAIISMIVVNFLATYIGIPPWLKHSKGVGLTVADLVAPFFLVTLGLMYKKSLLKRISRDGRVKAWLHMVSRYFLIFLVGTAGVCIARGHFTTEWGVLQSIGVAGVLALPLVELDFRFQIAAALGMVLFYQLVIFPAYHTIIMDARHGGIYATISWASMLLLGVAAGNLFDLQHLLETVKGLCVFGLATLIPGVISLWVVPISKMQVNLSYVLIATGLAVFVFITFLFLNEKLGISIPTLRTMGRNAFFLYIVHYLLIQLVHLMIPDNAGLLLIFTGAVFIYALCFILAWYLDSKKFYLKF